MENSRLDGQVGLVLKKRPEEHGEVAEDDDDDDCHFYSTILTPNQTAAIVKMIKQVKEGTPCLALRTFYNVIFS